ncbi:protein EIN4-like [Andrographis paniculata]|uniref:protein EIN4-like n=1 Tax=Andrographis paniculata TaxID=175694 RepID=UPI0021E76151|nr:protein EIN4-like [Andrographis paniculata]XP_051128263.1 protein EIN4-like [Andrographis paniculata]XP_051128271.1 protein EIN4-like [Andrographis paniculata]
MSKNLAYVLLFLSFFLSVAAEDDDVFRCNCDEVGFWSIEGILECQKVSDFLIAVAYFSIPIELLYFVTCSSFPFKWVLFQFIAFIVLCGLTHLLNGWTYGPHSFQLMLALTVAKFLTALVSFATAITLVTLIPLLLKIKVREFMLQKKTWDLDREVGIIKKQKEAGLHVRMLTQEIRKSLDRHTILYTTLVELSKTLDLKNCAVWMPNQGRTEMHLTHELDEKKFSNIYRPPIPTSDPEVRMIKGSDRVKLLDPEGPLAFESSGGVGEPGSVAAIRMPMLRVSNFKGGTPEMVPACYAILVLVLPEGQSRFWSKQELDIVEVVADQVAVALSHASVLEESQLMREKLADQNRALEQAKQNALMASQARNAFQIVMSDGLRRPMHSILGLLSVLQDEKLGKEQKLLVDTMIMTGNVLSTSITDVMDTSTKDNGKFPLEMRSFTLHSTIKQVACLSKCLSSYKGFGFVIDVDKFLPNQVIGDERRVFQVILHMIGHILNASKGSGVLNLRVYSANGGSQGSNEQRWNRWGPNSSDGYAWIKLVAGIFHSRSLPDNALPVIPSVEQTYIAGIEENLSFDAFKKLVQLMQGDVRVIPNQEGCDQSMSLVLRLQTRASFPAGVSDYGESSDHVSNSLLRGLNILLADADDVNRAVTRKLLEKLGCIVTAVSSGYECLSALGPAVSSFQFVLLDLHLPGLDGFEVTMRIRKFRSRSWPLIVALSSSDDGDTRDKCVQIGMNGVIQKPGSSQEIAYELKRALLHANRLLP